MSTMFIVSSLILLVLVRMYGIFCESGVENFESFPQGFPSISCVNFSQEVRESGAKSG